MLAKGRRKDRLPHRATSRYAQPMRNRIIVILLGLALATGAFAQKPVRLYILDGGVLKSADPKFLYDKNVLNTVMGVTAYLVVHPKGALLWDAGVIPDAMVKPEGTTVA